MYVKEGLYMGAK